MTAFFVAGAHLQRIMLLGGWATWGSVQKHYLEPSLPLTDCIRRYYSWLPGSPVNRPAPQLATPQASARQAATVADPPLVDLGDLPAVRTPPFVEAGASSPPQLRGKRGLD